MTNTVAGTPPTAAAYPRTTETLARMVADTRYEDLPEPV
jgi:hypothetical protein